MEEMIGRPLNKGEIVHHIDGDKGNNNKDNLHLCFDAKEHNTFHGQLEALAFLLMQKGEIIFCKYCRLYFLKGASCDCSLVVV